MTFYIILAAVTVCGFLIPPESSEKIGLGVTILIALVFIMQIVTEMQPPSSDIPIIMSYLSLNFVTITVMLVSG